MKRGAKSSHAPSGRTTSMRSPTGKFSEPLLLRVFTEVSSGRHYGLNLCPLVVNSIPTPSPLPGSQGVGLKVSTLDSCLVLSGDQPPS